MTEADASFNLRAAVREFEENKAFAKAPITSRAYAQYAQAAYNLRHAERVASCSTSAVHGRASNQKIASTKPSKR
jgi:hypothetical protein